MTRCACWRAPGSTDAAYSHRTRSTVSPHRHCGSIRGIEDRVECGGPASEGTASDWSAVLGCAVCLCVGEYDLSHDLLGRLAANAPPTLCHFALRHRSMASLSSGRISKKKIQLQSVLTLRIPLRRSAADSARPCSGAFSSPLIKVSRMTEALAAS